MNSIARLFFLFGFSFLLFLFSNFFLIKNPEVLEIPNHAHISLIGNNLCSRMMNFGYFETDLQLRYPEKKLFIRNLCDGGDTPGFRPHSGRNTPWPFEGADKFQTDLAQNSGSVGKFRYPDEWLTDLKTDIILAFFGYNESFQGPEGLDNFKAELNAFILHTLSQKYNGKSAPKLAIVSPIAFQDLSYLYDLPDGEIENANLRLYTRAMREVCQSNNVLFIDAFSATENWFQQGKPYTEDGFQLNDLGYKVFSDFLINQLFGSKNQVNTSQYEKTKDAVLEKNWYWHNYYKIPNGVHVYGRRYDPFGPENYPAELVKLEEMIANRDTLIWSILENKPYNLEIADSKTSSLPQVQTNYKSDKEIRYLSPQESLTSIHMAPGYKIELFASEQDFPDLANPSQMSFDNKGRLWVAVMPTYPHFRPGDPKPNDKLLIFEDTDNDGKADKQTVFADHLHIPAGFELTPEGVYVSQGTNLKLLIDENGDDKVDRIEIVLSGFDDHDTHHVISAFCADPSGAIYMGEGVFLHSNVETAYGPVRGTNGGFMRYSPQKHYLERTAQIPIPNPWGIAFDDYGQYFFEETSGPDVRWMMPSTIKPKYGVSSPNTPSLIEEGTKVRPTSGLEFISSRHFPDEVQGDLMLNNTIGFLGTKVHRLNEKGTGYEGKFQFDLLQSDDTNFRPVDMEFAPDGSLFFIDWHNVLIGHMQHNARDPLRDHMHGRIYRVTYPSRPLVQPAKIYGASIKDLLENLKLPEYRTRYRTRRELRGRDEQAVLKELKIWANSLNPNDKNYEHHILEALWVSWGLDRIDPSLLLRCLNARDYKVRAAAVQVVRYNGKQIKNQENLLRNAASDPHGRVRLASLVAASWLPNEKSKGIIDIVKSQNMDEWIQPIYEAIMQNNFGEKKAEVASISKSELDKKMELGKSIYERDGFCQTCHQANGKGLVNAGFPPLNDTKWVTGSEDRLIKIVLKGMMGPIEVNGKKYAGTVPMTPFGGMLNDEEVAAVLTYVRKSFGNSAPEISKDKVNSVRNDIKSKEGFYLSNELLKLHPMN